MRVARQWRRFAILTFVALAAAPRAARAQDDIVLDLFRTRVDVAVDKLPDRPLLDDADGNPVDGEYGSQGLYLDANIPLGSVHIRPGNKVIGTQWFAHAFFQGQSPDITFLSQDHQLYNGLLAASALMLSRGKNLYWASGGASFAEDDQSLHDLKPRFFGLFVGTHRFGPRATLLYGGSYTYVFGRGLPLPIIGARWTLNPKWTLTGMLPFIIDARYEARKDLAIRIRLAPQGNRYRFANEGDFPGQPETVYLRLVYGRLLGEVDWAASDHFSLIGQAGIVRASRIAFAAPDEEDFFSTSAQAAGYLKIGARFTFGQTLLDQWRQ